LEHPFRYGTKNKTGGMGMANVYHVSKQGMDTNNGSVDQPFYTIQRAADMMQPGDTVIVHEGEYREWVKPKNGGLSEDCRITYEAAPGEKVIIKGSEPVTGWENIGGSVWRTIVKNEIFKGYNPFAVPVYGDWLVAPVEPCVHTGELYINGKSCYETFSFEQVKNPVQRNISPYEIWGGREEAIKEPEQTLYQYWVQVELEETILYANFQGKNPNQELVEINVRPACFFPEKTGLNYITVRGFEMAQAATRWAPPTAGQIGLIGPNWSKGWVIENNRIHDAKCSAISLGKESTTGDNDCSKWHRKPGYQYQMEAVFKALHIGWSKETIGSHIVRNNTIYDCGQNGIVGHMGCIFSEIYGNEIYHIAVKHEFYGHEIAGIKLHAAIDAQIHHNYIHNCSLGMWLDWEAQGTRVSGNLFDRNDCDFMIEVTHGPCTVDHNIFTSPYAIDNAAQGTAFVHNLICGFINHYPVLNRSTPYHFPHSTKVLGTVPVYGNDDRFFQNIFIGGTEKERCYGTAEYNGSPISLEEYMEQVLALGNEDVELYEQVKQPAYIEGNIYINGAKCFEREKYFWEEQSRDNQNVVHMIEKEDGIYVKFHMPAEFFDFIEKNKTARLISSKDLGTVRLTGQRFENPDGTSIYFTNDMAGREHGENPVPGPLQELSNDRQEIWAGIYGKNIRNCT